MLDHWTISTKYQVAARKVRSIATLEEKCPRPSPQPTRAQTEASELIGIDPDHRSQGNGSSHLNNQPIARLIRVSGDQINTSEDLIKESEEYISVLWYYSSSQIFSNLMGVI